MKIVYLLLVLLSTILGIKHVGSFEELGTYHCDSFPVEIFYRLSSGNLAQKYGAEFAEIDCYILQFINKDGQDLAEGSVQDQSDQSQQSSEQLQNQQLQNEQLPQIDPILLKYAQGIQNCLPKNTNSTQAVYQMWRFVRFIVQHDYAYEWMRAKIRACIGYEAQRPSSWMDGQLRGQRVRLQKLFSNQFYDYVDKLMFKDFLHPIMTFLRKNVIVAMDGHLTASGHPLLLQFIQTKNIMQQVFIPVMIKLDNGVQVFSYTIPGIPLLLAGATQQISWGFSGVLVDRSNIQQIQTVGNKFYHYDSEMWIKLDNTTISIPVAGQQQPYTCSYMHSNYGTLYEKHSAEGKVSQYITRWHENEKKVRVLFSELVSWVEVSGALDTRMQFPFNSLVFANVSGIFHYICYQHHPSYFLYADLASQPQHRHPRWVKNPSKHYIVVANTHLTTTNPQSYLKKEVQNSKEEQIILKIKSILQQSKPTHRQWFRQITKISTDPQIRFRKQLLIKLYRKVKFLFFPTEQLRKECDQLIAALQNWDNDYSAQKLTPIFILWQYYLRQYTFNYISSSKFGADVVKHKAITETYWTNQMKAWQSGTSYGECDSNLWSQYAQKLNGTGHNSTCYLNIMRSINKTREVLKVQDGFQFMLQDFTNKKTINITQQYKGNDIDEAFGNYFSKQLAFVAEIGSNTVHFMRGYDQKQAQANLSQTSTQQQVSTQQSGLDQDL